MTDELAHYGVKGMWKGVRKQRPLKGHRRGVATMSLSDIMNSPAYKEASTRGARMLADILKGGGIQLGKIGGENTPRPIANISRKMFETSSKLRRYSDMKR